MESEPMLTPKEKSPLSEKLSSEEDRTHDALSSRTSSPTHYQRGIPAPIFIINCQRFRPPYLLITSIKCPRPGRASELEDFGCGLAWRGMGSAKRHCPRVTAWNVSQKEHHTGSVVARVTKDCASGCTPRSCRWKVDYWCAKKDHPCQKQHHHWHLECKNTRRYGKTRRTPTWDEKIWLEYTRTLWVMTAQGWREKHTGRSPTILEWPRQHTWARCWAPCPQEHRELRHRLLPNLK